MSLSIGVQPGSQIGVGDKVVTVLEVLRGRVIKVEAGGKTHLITDQQRVEVFPQVFLSYGSPYSKLADFKGARLAFDAPISMKISRLTHAV